MFVQSQKKKRNGRFNQGRGPGGSTPTPFENTSLVNYRGPSRLPTNIRPEVETRELHALITIASSAGGLIDSNVTSSNGGNGVRQLATNFSSFANLWREYRTLSVRIEYHPAFINCNPQSAGPANAICAPFWSVVDRDDASASVTFANIQDNSSLRINSLMQPFTRQAKMSSIAESQFVESNADNAAFFSLKWFTTGVTASTTFGQMYIRWIVEFKTRV
jgi:hypothetical protein